MIRPTPSNTAALISPSSIVWLQSHLALLLAPDAAHWMVASLVRHAGWMSHLIWLTRNALGLEQALFGPTLKVYGVDMTAIP